VADDDVLVPSEAPPKGTKVDVVLPVAAVSPGETVGLLLEVDAEIDPTVDVGFTCTLFDSDDPSHNVHATSIFSELLTAEKSKPRQGSKRKLAFRLPWVVKGMNPPFQVEFSVKAKDKQGNPLVSSTPDKLHVPLIKATKLPILTKIMLHEFHQADGTFDQAPLDAYIKSLSFEQKRLLLNYKTENRLVVFITLYSEAKCGSKLIGGDYCPKTLGPRPFIKPNATFSVFHCQGVGKNVTLVCHTEHFLLNMRNNWGTKNTTTFMKGTKTSRSGRSLTPAQWLDKSNTEPLMFKVATWLPQLKDGDDGVMWSVHLTPTGENIMPGNTMHGMINTKGCWMLFRNYNWPQAQFELMNHVYNNVVRREKELHADFVTKLSRPLPWKPEDIDTVFAKPQLRPDRRALLLASGPPLSSNEKDSIAAELWWDLAYDDTTGLGAAGYKTRAATTLLSDSYEKFIGYDKNFAYAWFFRHVVGVQYFSRSWKYGCALLPSMNEHNVTQTPPESRFPFVEAGKLAANDGGFVHHDPDVRTAVDGSFTPSDALFTKNALGFQTAQGFVRGLGDTTQADVDKCSWADVYYYRETDAPNPPRNFGI
jgi:hypothetical protein